MPTTTTRDKKSSVFSSAEEHSKYTNVIEPKCFKKHPDRFLVYKKREELFEDVSAEKYD